MAAGSASKILELTQNPPSGTRVVGLAVAGAFHTSFMESAKDELTSLATSLSASNPDLIIWSNSDGSTIERGDDFLKLLVDQVSKPVRWDKTMDSMSASGVTKIIELLPGGALSGIAKRSMPGAQTLALKSPEDLQKAVGFISEQG